MVNRQRSLMARALEDSSERWRSRSGPADLLYHIGQTAGLSLPQFSSVQWLSHVRLFVTPWTAACQASLSITNSQSLLELMSIQSVMPFNHLILHHPLLLPSIFPSIRVFSNESMLRIRWAKYWSFSFSPSNEYSGLISCNIDWFDLLAVQGTLKSLLQHQSPKASILQHSTFFLVQISHQYITTGKTKALTIWTFVGKVMSLLFNTLSRFVIAFLPRRKHRNKEQQCQVLEYRTVSSQCKILWATIPPQSIVSSLKDELC